MENRFLGMVIGATVAIITVSVLLVPIISDYADSAELTKTNIGADMAAIDESTSKTITVSGHTATIDGTDYTYAKIFVTDRFYAQWVGGSTNALGIRGLDDNNDWVGVNLSAATFTVAGKTISVTGTTTSSESFSASWDVGWGFYLYNDGGYTFIETASTEFFVTDTDQIYTYYTWVSSISGYAIFGSSVGTVATLNKTNGTSETVDVTFSTTTVDDSEIESLIFSSSLIDVKINTTSATVQGCVVPEEVTGEINGREYISIILVIPVIVILAILVAVVRTVMNRY